MYRTRSNKGKITIYIEKIVYNNKTKVGNQKLFSTIVRKKEKENMK